MGSSASKPAKAAASAAARRKYPKQPSSSTTSSPSSQSAATGENNQQKQGDTARRGRGPVYHSTEKASESKSEAIDLDARDPDFAASLRSIGPVTPNPTLSHSSTASTTTTSTTTSQTQQSQTEPPPPPPPHPTPSISNNPALLTLSARETLTRAAEREAESLGRTSHAGRTFLDAVSIKRVIAMRDRQGLAEEVIERHMRMKQGVVGRLGGKGRVVGEVR